MRPPWGRACGGAARTRHWYRAASRSQTNAAHRHGRPPRLDIEVAMRRGLHRGDERLPGEVALEAAKLFRRDDDDFVAPMHRHVLRPFAADAPHQLAEA